MLPPIVSLSPEKEIWRARMKEERKAAAVARPDAGKHAARNFMAHIPLPQGAIVALYHPLTDELDTEPLFDALREAGFEIALPVTPKKKKPLTFRRFRMGDALIESKFGVMEPAETAKEVTPDIIVAPLLAFDRGGARLGYGGGYYDRTLEKLRESGDVLAVGYAFGAQEIDGLPVKAHDQRLDWIVTERKAIRAAK